MTLLIKTVTITFDREKDDRILEWLIKHNLTETPLSPLTCSATLSLRPSEIDEDELMDYVEDIDFTRTDEAAIERAYRYLAEGDIDAAMSELHARFHGLRTPSDERKLTALLTRKAPAHVPG